MREVSSVINLSAYQSYQTLFNSMSQVSNSSSSGLNQLPGAYFVGKYGAAINKSLSSQTSGFFKEFRQASSDLKSAAQTLSKTPDQSTVSSPTQSVTGTTTTNTINTLKIQQLATKQVNQGKTVASNSKTTLSEGTHTLNIGIGDKSYAVQVDVKATDTNKNVMESVSKKINDLNIGVSGKVSQDTLGNSQLTLESKNTGADNGFTVSGDLAGALGADQNTQAAKDAKFIFNDKDYQTSSNDVTLDNGKTKLTLKKTTDGEENLTLKKDTSAMQKNIEDFVSTYNTLQSTLANQSDNQGLQSASNQLKSTLSRFEGKLSDFGITQNSQGQLQIDKDQLAKGLENNGQEAKDLFNRSSGIAGQIASKTQQLMSLPASKILMNANTSSSSTSASYSDMLGQMMNSFAKSSQSTGNLFDMLL